MVFKGITLLFYQSIKKNYIAPLQDPYSEAKMMW